MSVTLADPEDSFPAIGTMDDPAFFSDGRDLLMGYKVAPVAGGGTCILRFSDVIDFRQLPDTVEGRRFSTYQYRPWQFTEVLGSERTGAFRALSPRLWTISFEDMTVEIVFRMVDMVERHSGETSPCEALTAFIAADGTPKGSPPLT